MYLGKDFSAAYARMEDSLGVRGQERIGARLGIQQSSVHNSIKKKCLPSNWLMTLLFKYHINPQWILYGDPHKPYLVPAEEAPNGFCKTSRMVRKKGISGSPPEVPGVQDVSLQRLVRGKPPRTGRIRFHRKNFNRSRPKENQNGDFQKD